MMSVCTHSVEEQDAARIEGNCPLCLGEELRKTRLLLNAHHTANRVYAKVYGIAKDALVRLEGKGAKKVLRELERIEGEEG